MKKSTFFSCIAIFILSIALCIHCMGQSMLGSTLSDIKEQYPNAVVEYKSTGTLISVEKKDITWLHLINQGDQYCSMSGAIPANNAILSGIIEYYNNHFVIISKTEWNQYIAGYCIAIKLVTTEADQMFFTYKLCKED